MRVVDRLILSPTVFRRLCIAGLLCLPACGAWFVFLLVRVNQHEPDGLATAVFGVGLSMAAMFSLGWKRERGLWMLHALGGLFLLLMVLGWVAGVTRDLQRDPARFWPEGVDMGVALLSAALSGRLLLTAAVSNWRRFRPRSDDGPAPSPPPPEPLPVPAGLRPQPPSLSAAARPPRPQVAGPR